MPCPECGQTMPAGYGRRCRVCDWTQRAMRQIRTDQIAFDSDAMAERFGGFGRWLIRTAGPHAAALKLNRYHGFFVEIERIWGDIPDYVALLGRFGTEGLRRWKVPMRWMDEDGLIAIDATKRKASSERRRITAIRNRLPENSTPRAILEGYYTVLLARRAQGTLSLAGLRSALSPAASLLQAAYAAGEDRPSQKTLDVFLQRTPGLHAALVGLVGYLRDHHETALAMPPYHPGAQVRRRHEHARCRIKALMREDGTAHDYRQRWRAVALTYFHDLPMKASARVGDEDVSLDRGGLSVHIKGQSYWIPRPPAEA